MVVYGKIWKIDDFDLTQNLKHDSVDGDGGLFGGEVTVIIHSRDQRGVAQLWQLWQLWTN